jgi:hypothetical protein
VPIIMIVIVIYHRHKRLYLIAFFHKRDSMITVVLHSSAMFLKSAVMSIY